MLLKFFLVVALASTLSSCVKKTQYRGYYFGGSPEMKVKSGMKVEEVMENMGSPTTSSALGKPIFFYVGSKYEQKAFFTPKLVEQKILSVHFSSAGEVEKVESYNLGDAEEIKFSKEHTEIEGNKMGILEQVLGNIGRFSKEGRKPGI